MKIHDIERHLIDLKDLALSAHEVDQAQREAILLADAPNPELGDRGFPVFALARAMRKGPPQIAQQLAGWLNERISDDPLVARVIAAGPYVNFTLKPQAVHQITLTQALSEGDAFGSGGASAPQRWMIEYSAPNTNKPQHLGHARNNLLGHCVANILAFAGHEVTRVNLINDRGIHICKSMLAYERFGAGETPQSSGMKGDHLVGKYYVVFNTKLDAEYAAWQRSDAASERLSQWLDSDAGQRARKELGDAASDEALRSSFFKAYGDAYFNNESALGQAARAMLVAWEAGDEAVINLWRTMNGWVFAGFDQTYARMGVRFDKVYYESQTYKLGKELVQQGLQDGLFETIEGGAIACDLAKIGMPGSHKVLLRGDGTSVYMTQDLGTALSRFDAYAIERMAYVVGDEQQHHFKVLFGILSLMRPALQGALTHLSYGMVELPDGRMKSRTGRVVDADDLMSGLVELAREQIIARDATLDDAAQAERAEAVGLSALKYYLLNFNPATTIKFNPEESLEPTGRTGPYLLYTYARIQSIARELGGWPKLDEAATREAIAALGSAPEQEVLHKLRAWPHLMDVAARDLDPSKVTEALWQVAKAFSTLYNDRDHRIKAIEGPRRDGLLLLCQAVAHALATGLRLLGISPIDRM